MSSAFQASNEVEKEEVALSEGRLSTPVGDLWQVIDLAHAMEMAFRGRRDFERCYRLQEDFAKAYRRLPK